MSRFRGENRYDHLVRAASAFHLVPKPIIKAVIGAESAFNPKAYRAEPAINDASRGLMQLLEKTAASLGFNRDMEQLYDPLLNINLGAQLLAENYKHAAAAHPDAAAGTLWEIALSAYNAGWSRERANDAKRDRSGAFVNQAYVDKVLRLAHYFGPVLFLRVPPVALGSKATATAVVVVALAGLYWFLFHS